MTKRESIEKWFRAWLDCDGTCIADVFSEDVLYSECYGPVYVGRAQVEKWFADWNVNNRVTRWDIFDFVEQGDNLAVEWHFECDCAGEWGGFNGMTLAKFDESGHICSLKEFQSQMEHVYPYGEPALMEK